MLTFRHLNHTFFSPTFEICNNLNLTFTTYQMKKKIQKKHEINITFLLKIKYSKQKNHRTKEDNETGR